MIQTTLLEIQEEEEEESTYCFDFKVDPNVSIKELLDLSMIELAICMYEFYNEHYYYQAPELCLKHKHFLRLELIESTRQSLVSIRTIELAYLSRTIQSLLASASIETWTLECKTTSVSLEKLEEKLLLVWKSVSTKNSSPFVRYYETLELDASALLASFHYLSDYLLNLALQSEFRALKSHFELTVSTSQEQHSTYLCQLLPESIGLKLENL
jgi:hypothetical protein